MRPIVIIGGGLAALGAASVLRDRKQQPLRILEASSRLGGRLADPHHDTSGAETSKPFFSQDDAAIWSLVNESGLMVEASMLSDGIVRIGADGKIVRTANSYSSRRVALQRGWESLFGWFQRFLKIETGVMVDSITWNEWERCFNLGDARTGKALLDASHRKPYEAEGVVLAVTATQAAKIAKKSPVLAPIAAQLSGVRYEPRAVGIFQTSRIDPGFYAAEGGEGLLVEWLAFEERKQMRGNPPEHSHIVVRANLEFSKRLANLSQDQALAELWAQARKMVPMLPEAPAKAEFEYWRNAWPEPGTEILLGPNGTSTNPSGLPLELAGDYIDGRGAEAAARSGMEAARRLLRKLEVAEARR